MGVQAIGDMVQGAGSGLLASVANQLGGVFLLPGSTFSIAALVMSLAVAFVAVAAKRGRTRDVRIRVLIRALFPRRLHRTASGRADFAFFVLNISFAGILFGGIILSADQVAQMFSAAMTQAFGHRQPVGAPAMLLGALATLALFLAYEFAYWFDHWSTHKIPVMWQFHKVHHSAESLSLLTNFRVHPVETFKFATLTALIMGLVGGAVAYGLGGHVRPFALGGTNILIFAFAVVLNHLQHSHLWITLGPRWGRLLLGPAHHQIHHSADPLHHDRNFGSSLALWDRVFGTFHAPAAKRESLTFGVESEAPRPHGAVALVWMPFVDAFRCAGRGAARITGRRKAPLAGTAPPAPLAG